MPETERVVAKLLAFHGIFLLPLPCFGKGLRGLNKNKIEVRFDFSFLQKPSVRQLFVLKHSLAKGWTMG